MAVKVLNLFYKEPDPDRWFPFDRYPRRIIRRIVRGKPRPGGQIMVAVNLLKGLDRLGIPYRFNDFKYIRKHSEELACIIGKPHVLFERQWKNPVLFGASVYSHAIDVPDLFEKYPNVKKVLVPGEWMRKMFEPYYGDKVIAWPVGTDTEEWKPEKVSDRKEFLLYLKILWEKEEYYSKFIPHIKKILEKYNLSYDIIEYMKYKPHDLKQKLASCKRCIVISFHETQGLAYQQILSTNTPILAWDRGGYWQDPYYFPHRVKFEPVSSAPYWDARCGEKFKGLNDFEEKLLEFIEKDHNNLFHPRQYILDNLTLERCAQQYVDIAGSIPL